MRSSSPLNQNLEDSGLVPALKAGEAAAFKQIYLERFEELCNYASTIVSDDEAMDIVQDVLWRIWQQRHDLKVNTDLDLSYFLLRSVRNKSLDALRRSRVRRTNAQKFSEDTFPLSKVRGANEVDEHFYGDDEFAPEADTDGIMDRVEDVINALPDRSREILILRWFHGFGLEKISSIMGISYGSARVLHSRALAVVKERLKVG